MGSREDRVTSDTTPSREEMVQKRAYAIWMEAGQPEGMADEHWHKAAAAVDAEEAAVSPLTDLGQEPAPLVVTPNR